MTNVKRVDINSAPTATHVNDAAGFVEKLGQLRLWAGQPSFRRLAALAGTTVTSDGHVVDKLPTSTIADVLAGKRLPRLPRMEVVGVFVQACLQACDVPSDVIEKVTARWLAEWRRLAGLQQCANDGLPTESGESGDVARYASVEMSCGTDRPLVGRADVVREFEHALDDTTAGRPQFVAVVGEPGTGKTRLLRELAIAAARRGLVTLWGRPGQPGREIPLGVFVDALDDHLERRDRWVRERLGAEHTRHLSTVLPALAATAPDTAALAAAGTHESTHYRRYRAVRRLLEELAPPSGVALLLDDVHRADTASTELIDHLLRHPPHGRVLLATAYRPAQVAPQLTALIESGFRHVRRIPVNPLTEQEAQAFVTASAGRAWRRAVYAASGGIALYLDAFARMDAHHAPAGGCFDLDENPDRARQLPHAIRAALEVELRGLSPTGLLVAQAAAVVGGEFEASVVAVGAQVDDDAVLASLDEMSAHDIVRPTGWCGRFQFRHPLIRVVAYGLTAPGWRLAAHARIAAHLASIGAPAANQASHSHSAASPSDHTTTAIPLNATD